MAFVSVRILLFIQLSGLLMQTFKHGVDAAPTGCEGEQWGTFGTLLVPDFIRQRPADSFSCTWHIRATPHYQQIVLRISKLKLPRKFVDCRRGYLLIVDLRGKVVEKLCGGAYPRTVTIRGNGATITYYANSRISRSMEFNGRWVAAVEKYDDKSCGAVRGFEASRRHRYMSAGVPIPSQMLPWVVKVVIYFHDSNSIDGEMTCAGTLIDSQWVLTSITCAFPDKIIRRREVHVGAGSDRNVVTVTEARMYPYYNGQMSDDVALIRLAKRLPIDYSVRPACLTAPDAHGDVGGSCWIADANRDTLSSPWTLRVTQVQLWQGCLQTKSTICTMYAQKPADACRGSTGGAVMCSDRSGTVSVYGILSRKPGQCGAQFEGFVNVNYYRAWIRGIVNGSEPNLPGINDSNYIDPIHSNKNH